MSASLPYSLLDLAPIPEGADAGTALRQSLELAQSAERWGYTRYWMAEHHNMPGVASAATAVCLGHIAQGTSRIRVGAGGVMLPNHAPLVIAEQFGTLASLYPGRIDLGLGRAPGTDSRTTVALRADPMSRVDSFPDDVVELQHYFEPESEGQAVRAIPGVGLRVPLWILGSSLHGAQLAAALGLPFAFASHFAPDHLMDALDIYRDRFRPSLAHPRPHAMVLSTVIVAETDARAQLLQSSLSQQFLKLRRGNPGALPPPVENFEARLTPPEQAMLDNVLRCSAVGSPETVQRRLQALVTRTQADELMVTAQVYDHRERLWSFEQAAVICRTLTRAPADAPAAARVFSQPQG